MTDPKSMDFDRWRELAELLGLPAETPPPDDSARPTAPRSENRSTATAVQAEQPTIKPSVEVEEVDAPVLDEPDQLGDAVDDVVDTEVLPPEALEESEPREQPEGEEEPRKRRRRRRGRRSRSGEPAAAESDDLSAEVAPAAELEGDEPSEGSESEQEPIDPLELGPPKREREEDGDERGRRRRRRRRGRGRGKDKESSEPMAAEGGDVERRRSERLDDQGADIDELDESRANGHDLDDDDAPLPNEFENWDVPPWQELIDSLYRPDR